jgi:integrase
LQQSTKTVGVLVAAYYDWLSNSGRQQTAKGYQRITRNWLSADFAGKATSEVTPAQVAALIRKPFEAGHVRTASTLRAILSAAFNAASKAALDPRMPTTLQGFGVTANPVASVPAFPVGTSEVFATLTQMRKYAQILRRSVSTRGIDASMTDAFLLVHLLLGAPRLAQLRRATITDWAGGTLVLEDLKTGGSSKPKRLVFPAGPVAAGLLDSCTARAVATGSEFLFAAAKQSQPVTTTGVSTRAHKLLDGLSPASLRRGVETALAEAGVEYELRARLLGHGLSGVVYRHYNRADHSDDLHKVLVQWEEMLR